MTAIHRHSLGSVITVSLACAALTAFYKANGPKQRGWSETLRRWREDALFTIDHHPEHYYANLWTFSPTADPVGYRAARAAWLAQTRKRTATAPVLVNAANFIWMSDPPLTESLLLRARTLDPGGRALISDKQEPSPSHWAQHFGYFYGELLAPRDSRFRAPDGSLPPLDATEFARVVRQNLEHSDDPALLVAVASHTWPSRVRDAARRALGDRLLQRALTLDPHDSNARQLRALWDRLDRAIRVEQRFEATNGRSA